MRPIAAVRAVLLGLALGALAQGPAAARERFPIHGERLNARYLRTFYDDSAPQLVKGGVAYVDEPGNRALVRYRASGEPPRRLHQFDELSGRAPGRGLAGYLELAGDADRVALARYDSDPRFGPKEGPGAVVASTLDGPPRTVVECKHGLLWGPQMSGSALMLLVAGPRGSRCDSPLRPRVFDLATHDVFTLPVNENANDPTIGGRYAVWDDQIYENGRDVNRGIVYDYRGRRVVQISRRFDPVAVGTDGTIAARTFKSESDRCGKLWSYNPELPGSEPHQLPYFTCWAYSAEIVRSRIVFLAGAQGWPLRGPRQRLMLGDTAGSPARPLTERYAWDFNGTFGYDFDGDRVAYRTYSCTGTRMLNVDEVSTALARGPIEQGTCSAKVQLPESPVDLAHGFGVGIDCPRGCDVRFTVRQNERSWKLVPDRRMPLSPGHHALHLTAPSAKPATDKVVRAGFKLRVYQPDGHVAPAFDTIRILKPRK